MEQVDGIERVWRPGRPVPVAQILSILRRGGGDPTYRTAPDGTVWRGLGTPDGPATLATRADPPNGAVVGRAWGPGADWALDRLPRMLGERDDCRDFEPRHSPIHDAWRRHPHWRLTRTELVMEALVPAILEQKVTGKQAFAGFRSLVHRFGQRAPGPGVEREVWVQPSAAEIRQVPSWEWLQMGVDPQRSRTMMAACRYAANLERAVELGVEEADTRLRAIPGIGVWTSAEVRSRALGDADALSVGDYHVARNITWALTGVVGNDDDMVALLEPYRPHRHRVQRLVDLAHLHRPRHGPRMSIPTHLPTR